MDKTIFKIGLLFTILVTTMTSCYKDISSLSTHVIEEVNIDTTGIAKDQYVDYLSKLIIEPKLGENSSNRNLSFKWQITEKPDLHNLKLEEIGKELKLEYHVVKPIASQPYHLFLTITDHDNSDLEYIYSWPVTVQGPFISGLVIADTQNSGSTSDLNYIKSRTLSTHYTGEENQKRNILKDAGNAILGKVKKIDYAYWGNLFFGPSRFLWVSTDEGQLYKYDLKDFKLVGSLEDDKIIIYKSGSDDIKVYNHFSAGRYYFLDTSSGIYRTGRSKNETSFTILDNVLADVKFSEHIVGASASKSTDFAIYYDQGRDMIEVLTERNSRYQKNEIQKSDAFDPQNLKGYKTIAADMSANEKQGQILLKKSSTGAYELYTISTHVPKKGDTPEQPTKAERKYTFSEESKTILETAVSVFFSKKQNLMYVATPDKVYVFVHGGSGTQELTGREVFAIPGGEKITKGKLFIQGEYNLDPNYVSANSKRFPELAYNCKAIIIVSEKGNEGIVRIIPMDTDKATSGDLLKDKAEVFNGFGKILDVIHIGN